MDCSPVFGLLAHIGRLHRECRYTHPIEQPVLRSDAARAGRAGDHHARPAGRIRQTSRRRRRVSSTMPTITPAIPKPDTPSTSAELPPVAGNGLSKRFDADRDRRVGADDHAGRVGGVAGCSSRKRRTLEHLAGLHAVAVRRPRERDRAPVGAETHRDLVGEKTVGLLREHGRRRRQVVQLRRKRVVSSETVRRAVPVFWNVRSNGTGNNVVDGCVAMRIR
ncbi:hypothetical protein GCM10023065_31320 [Microbacterium laevaniformans]